MSMLNQDTARKICDKLGSKDAPRQKFALKPRAVEAGRIISLDLDGTKHEVPMGLLIQFESAAHLRQAIEDGRLEFSFLE